jgi:NCAIR mutase (PurE)-related protein
MNSLEAVRTKLLELVGSEARLSLINARVMLRTGVNLVTIRPGYTQEDVDKVVKALIGMGYAIEG